MSFIYEQYKKYLLEKVNYYNVPIFDNIMEQLLHTKYEPYYDLDDNRGVDGLTTRDIFYETFPPDARTLLFDELIMDIGPSCTVLEMMVTLAIRCETDVAGDPSGEDRTAHWFDVMLESMGLTQYTGDSYNADSVARIIWKMQNHDYLPNGEGGLFKIPDGTGFDMTKLEIWSQMNAYITVTEG